MGKRRRLAFILLLFMCGRAQANIFEDVLDFFAGGFGFGSSTSPSPVQLPDPATKPVIISPSGDGDDASAQPPPMPDTPIENPPPPVPRPSLPPPLPKPSPPALPAVPPQPTSISTGTATDIPSTPEKPSANSPTTKPATAMPITVFPEKHKNKSSPPPPPPRQTTATGATSESESSSTKTIIIAVSCSVGGVVLISVVTVLCCYFRKRKSRAASAGYRSDLERGTSKRKGNIMQGTSQKTTAIKPSTKRNATVNGAYASQSRPPNQLQSFDPFASSYTSAPRYGRREASNASAADPAGAPGLARPVGPMAAAAAHTMVTALRPPTRRQSERDRDGEVISPAPRTKNEATAQWLGMKPTQPTKVPQSVHKQTASRSDSLLSKSSTRLSYDIDFSSIDLDHQIGKGSFGKIFKANWNETPVAVKFLVNYEPKDRFQIDSLAGEDFQRQQQQNLLNTLEAEAEMLSVLRHPNVVQYLGVCTEPSSMCIVTEYCANGSLADVIRKKALKWDMATRMLLDAATGMLYLHSRNVLHCDLKSNNILVDTHYRTKICDFNMSKLIEESTGSSLANIQNPRWLAPEICEGSDSYSKASDVYSFGIVMWEILTGDVPWRDSKPWEIVQLIKDGGRPTCPNFWDCTDASGSEFHAYDEYVKLMTECWDQNPYSRPSFNQVIRELKEIILFTSSGPSDGNAPGSTNVDGDESADPRLFSNTSTKVFSSSLLSK